MLYALPGLEHALRSKWIEHESNGHNKKDLQHTFQTTPAVQLFTLRSVDSTVNDGNSPTPRTPGVRQVSGMCTTFVSDTSYTFVWLKPNGFRSVKWSFLGQTVNIQHSDGLDMTDPTPRPICPRGVGSQRASAGRGRARRPTRRSKGPAPVSAAGSDRRLQVERAPLCRKYEAGAKGIAARNKKLLQREKYGSGSGNSAIDRSKEANQEANLKGISIIGNTT